MGVERIGVDRSLRPGRVRTRTSVLLYTTSLALAALFLAGLFLVPRSTIVVGAPLFARGAPSASP